MGQTTYAALMQSCVDRCTAEHGIRDLTAVAGPVDALIVVLAHGIGGNVRHWSDPTKVSVNETWPFNLDAEPAPTSSGILASPPYAPGSVTSPPGQKATS